MRMQGLSFDKIPAWHVPFRFFNTAPWMGVLAALTLLSGDGSGLISQWSPTTLAATHLLTLGFMVMIMLGALFQMLPVISGVQIPKTPVVATIVHLALLVGVPLLASGFFFAKYQLFLYAVPVLITGFLVFLGAFGLLLTRKIGGGDSVFVLRFAALSLLVTILLGVNQALSYAGYPLLKNILNLTYIHLAWGLIGWVLLLVMGVSYQVIPMFHVTPNYPQKLARIIPLTIFIVMIMLTLFRNHILQGILVFTLFLSISVYSIFSIHLLSKRKRKITDITVNFWTIALVSICIASWMLIFRFYLPTIIHKSLNWQVFHILIGVIVIYGFACSVIMGMLQKIIPFLLYMHMQRLCQGDMSLIRTLPNMHQIITAKQSLWQLRLHFSAYIMVLMSVLFPIYIQVAAILMAVDFCWLGYIVARASRTFIHFRHAAQTVDP